ncbi:Nuclear GTPase SLIP-GC [Paramyrothecium foliicola]|nr:Nuclear GTPase SLIP-GC [Paramyrothecium foliicola]
MTPPPGETLLQNAIGFGTSSAVVGERNIPTRNTAPTTPSNIQMPNASEAETRRDTVDKVIAKEKALETAFVKLRIIQQKFKEANIRTSGLDLADWNDKLAEIEKEHDTFQYLVGVGGDTGLGKTSLLNALLHPTSDIAPASQAGACTAAVCCFRYHNTSDPSKKFRAVARFKSKTAVDKELELFFQDLKAFEASSSDAEAHDSVHRGDVARFRAQLELIHGWSGLDVDVIRKLGLEGRAADITTQCDGGRRFFNFDAPTVSHTQEVHHGKAPPFLKLVKPFVGGGRQKTQLTWPLVEVVDFYLNVDNVLRHGITLVDLPGEMDALESRSKVAHSYYQKLDQLMVVTPGDRAADNRTAMDLLKEEQILDMDADGKTESLCVVITKVDLLDWVSFVENEWNPEDISEDLPALKSRYDIISKKCQRLTSRINYIQSDSPQNDFDDDDSETGDEDNLSMNLKSASLQTLLSTRQPLEEEMYAINGKCLRACIDARSHDSKMKFQEHFDMIRNSFRSGDQPKVSTQLDVFPVSSFAQKRYATGKRIAGFDDAVATGFKPLEEWLIQGSLKKRDKHSDRLLRRSQVMFDSINGWIRLGSSIQSKLPEEELPKIKAALKVYQVSFANRLKDLQNRLRSLVTELPPNRRVDWASNNEKLARGFVSLVKKYSKDDTGEDLHSATYRALIRRSGGAFRSRTIAGRRDHDWQARTALDQLMVLHMHRIEGSSSLPELFRTAYQGDSRRNLNIFHDYRSRVEKVVTDYQAAMVTVRVDSRKFLCQEMEEAYSEAQASRGLKVTLAMQETMKHQAREIRETIFENVSKGIAANMRKAVEDLAKQHKKLDAELAASLAKLNNDVAEGICHTEATRLDAALSLIELIKFKDSLEEEIVEWEFCAAGIAHLLPDSAIRTPGDLVGVKAEPTPDRSTTERPVTEGPVTPSPAENGYLPSPSLSRGEKRQTTGTSESSRKMIKIEMQDE